MKRDLEFLPSLISEDRDADQKQAKEGISFGSQDFVKVEWSVQVNVKHVNINHPNYCRDPRFTIMY